MLYTIALHIRVMATTIALGAAIFCATALGSIFGNEAQALLASVSLNQMSYNAWHVFRGKITSTEKVRATVGNGALNAIKYTFKVSETLKDGVGGPDSKTFSFTMIGSLALYRQGLVAPNFPIFEKDVDYVVFMNKPSERSGLSSPVALEAGCFKISMENGKEVVENGVKNVGLVQTNHLKSNGPKRTPQKLTYSQLRSTVLNNSK